MFRGSFTNQVVLKFKSYQEIMSWKFFIKRICEINYYYDSTAACKNEMLHRVKTDNTIMVIPLE